MPTDLALVAAVVVAEGALVAAAYYAGRASVRLEAVATNARRISDRLGRGGDDAR